MKTRTGYLVKRGRTYYAVWKIKGKRYCFTTKQTDKDEAQKELNRLMQSYAIGDEIRVLQTIEADIAGKQSELAKLEDEANPPLKIGEAWTEYLQAQNRPDTGSVTLRDYEIKWGRFWTWMRDTHPTIKAMRDVTAKIASEFAANLTIEGKTPNTFNKYMNVMALVFRTLKDKARITDNPWDGIQRKRLVTHGRRELTLAELRTVCATAEGDLRPLFAIGLYTGLRLGDCCTLRWGEVDLARNLIRRIPNKIASRNPTPITIPIHPSLKALLTETPEADRTEYVLPQMASDYQRHGSHVTNKIQAHLVACGIQTTRQFKGSNRQMVEVGFHSLRHSFVSLCREANTPLSVVESIVGHSNPAMTRHYTHTSEAAAIAAIASLPSMTGETAKALPAPRTIAAAKVRDIADRLTATNWQEIQAELHTLVNGR